MVMQPGEQIPEGTDDGAEEGDASEPQAPETVTDLLQQAMAAASEPEFSAEPDPEEVGAELVDEEPEEDDEPEEGADEPEEPLGEEQPRKTAAQWVQEIISSGNLNLITQVPQSFLPEVTGAVMQAGAEAAKRQYAEAVTQRQETERLARARVKAVEDEFEDDPDGFLAWQRQNPKDAADHLQLQAWLAQLENGEAPSATQQAAEQTSLGDAARVQFERLADFPEQQQVLRQRAAESGRYPVTPQGLAVLSSDVDQLLRESLEAQVAEAKRDAPQARRAKRRGANARNRDALPKPVAPSGTTPAPANGNAPDISEVTDYRELLRMAAQ